MTKSNELSDSKWIDSKFWLDESSKKKNEKKMLRETSVCAEQRRKYIHNDQPYRNVILFVLK